jgi:hypothetical protein
MRRHETDTLRIVGAERDNKWHLIQLSGTSYMQTHTKRNGVQFIVDNVGVLGSVAKT